MSNLVNLTPHAINIIFGNETKIVEPSGTIARVSMTQERIGEVDDGIPVYRNSYGKPEGLPEPEENTYYIVSALLAQAVPEREDVLITSNPIRDEAGRIIGCGALAHI